MHPPSAGAPGLAGALTEGHLCGLKGLSDIGLLSASQGCRMPTSIGARLSYGTYAHRAIASFLTVPRTRPLAYNWFAYCLAKLFDDTGLRHDWLAAKIGVVNRTISRWLYEVGTTPAGGRIAQ